MGVRQGHRLDAADDAGLGQHAFGDQLDAEAETVCEAQVQQADFLDAAHFDFREIEVCREGDGGEDGGLVGGVHAGDVERRVGLGIAALLRFREHFLVGAAGLEHGARDEVAGAVEDAGDAFDFGADEAVAQYTDDRDAARDGGFEQEVHVLFGGEGGERDAVLGDQRLVGGDDMLAGLEGGFDGELGRAIGAADQFDEHVHIGVFGKGRGVIEPGVAVGVDRAVAALRAGAHTRNLDPSRQPQAVLALHQLDQPGADMAQACNPNSQRPHRAPLTLRFGGGNSRFGGPAEALRAGLPGKGVNARRSPPTPAPPARGREAPGRVTPPPPA